jgi:hypothetical protein
MSLSSLVQSIDTCWSVYLINLALAYIIHVLHFIWMARNNIHFNNANISVRATKMKILTSIYMSVNLAVGFSCIFGKHAAHCREFPGLKYRHGFKYRHALVGDVLFNIFRRAGIFVKKEALVNFLTNP